MPGLVALVLVKLGIEGNPLEIFLVEGNQAELAVAAKTEQARVELALAVKVLAEVLELAAGLKSQVVLISAEVPGLTALGRILATEAWNSAVFCRNLAG